MKRLLTILFALASLPAMAAHTVTLNWTAGSAGDDTGYNVYRSTGQCPSQVLPSNVGTTKLASPTATTYVDSTVTVGTYCYFVTGTANGSESSPSNAVNPSVLPSAPTGLTVVVQ